MSEMKSSSVTEKLLYIQNFKLFEKEMASLKYLHKFRFPQKSDPY